MNKITRQHMIVIAEFLEKHPELINFVRRSSEYTSSQETALWEELTAALGKRFKIKGPKSWTKDWIKTWWNDYAYDLNRAYMNVLTSPADTKLPAQYDVDLACRFLTVMGYDNVHRILSHVKEETLLSTYKKKKPQQQDQDSDIKITSYSILKTEDSLPDQTWEPSRVVITPVQPETAPVARKSTPKAPNIRNISRNASSSVSKTPRYFRPIAPKISESPPRSVTLEQEQFESPPNLVPNASKILITLPTPTPVALKKLKCPPCSAAIEQERFDSPNIVPIQPGTSENFTSTILEKSECPPDSTAVGQNISSPPYTASNNQKLSKNPPNSTAMEPLGSENATCNDSSISEKGQDGASSPNISVENALLAIAKEANSESTLAKRNMELKQNLLRLNKRKVAAVDLISKKLCLFGKKI